MAYLNHMSQSCAPSTLSTIISALKNQILLHHNIDIENFKTILKFVYNLNNKHIPKQAKTFETIHIRNYIKAHINQPEHYPFILGIHFAIAGGLRIDELVNLDFKDVKTSGDDLKVTIRYAKRDQAGRGTSFFVLGNLSDHELCPVVLYYKYLAYFNRLEGR